MMNTKVSNDMDDKEFASMYTSMSSSASVQPVEGETRTSALTELGVRSSFNGGGLELSTILDDSRYCDDAPFCIKDNLESSVKYLNQVMLELGMLPLLDGYPCPVDLVEIVNKVYGLVQYQYQLLNTRNELTERVQWLTKELTTVRQVEDRLRSEKAELEQELHRAKSSTAALMVANNRLTLQVKNEKDEVRRLQSVVQSRDIHYKHELKKKDLELGKIKNRIHTLLADKTDKKNGMVISEAKPKGSLELGNRLASEDNNEKVLLGENADLRQGLSDIDKELVLLLKTQKCLSSVDTSADENEYSHQIDDETDDCNSVNSRALSDDNSLQRSNEKRKLDLGQSEINEEMERLRSHLKQCKLVIEQQQEQLLAGYTCEAAYVDGDVFEEQELLAERRKYYEEALTKLTDATSTLLNQAHALEDAKYAYLHHEFMQVTPFRATRGNTSTVEQLGMLAVLTPARNPSIQLTTPTTTDLYRVLGLLENDRNHGDSTARSMLAVREGTCSGGGDHSLMRPPLSNHRTTKTDRALSKRHDRHLTEEEDGEKKKSNFTANIKTKLFPSDTLL